MSESGSGASRSVLLLAAAFLLAGAAMLAFVFLRPQGPELKRLDPVRARPGDTVILYGTGFDTASQGNVVLFGDRGGRVVGASATQLTVEVPAIELELGQTSNVAVRVLVGRSATNGVDLQVFREAAPVAVETPEVTDAPPVETAEAVVEPTPPPATPTGGGAQATPRPRPPRAATPAPPTPVATQPAAPAPVAPAVPPAQRRFVLERTAVESNKRANASLEGFETESVDLKRAPDVLGRVEFDVQPAQVKPGDRFTVSVYLINDGKKDISLKDMFVATNVNGRLVSGPATPKTRAIGPKKKTVIASFSDTWRDTIATWAMDVTVTSDRGDVYKNQIVWK